MWESLNTLTNVHLNRWGTLQRGPSGLPDGVWGRMERTAPSALQVFSPRAPLQVYSARRTQQIGWKVNTCAGPLLVFLLGPFLLFCCKNLVLSGGAPRLALCILRWGPFFESSGGAISLMVFGGEVKTSRFVGYVCPLPGHAGL